MKRLHFSLALCSVAATFALAAPASAADGAVEKVSVKATAHFGFDGTTLNPEDQARMLNEVGQMKDVTWQTIRATGHTDSVGAASYNEALSTRRAAKVKTFLVGKGLSPDMIVTEGKASEAPIADNDTPAGRAQNRRAEIEFLGIRSASR